MVNTDMHHFTKNLNRTAIALKKIRIRYFPESFSPNVCVCVYICECVSVFVQMPMTDGAIRKMAMGLHMHTHSSANMHLVH